MIFSLRCLRTPANADCAALALCSFVWLAVYVLNLCVSLASRIQLLVLLLAR
jgi:hypothetical protein